MTRDEGLDGVAATVCLLRDGQAGLEVLLLKRPDGRGSFPGAWVFPGGVIEPGDGDETEPEALLTRRAAVRETREETGLVILEDGLAPISTWTPPPEVPKRLRTWFYLAEAPDGEVRPQLEEVDDWIWLSPEEALARHARERLLLYPPTWVTLNLLRTHLTASDALSHARTTPPDAFITRRSPRGTTVFWQGDVAYEDDTLVGADGGRHRLYTHTLPWEYVRT